LSRGRRVAVLAVVLGAGASLPGPAPAADPVEVGKQTYQRHCAQCHGDAGDGQGYAAVHLLPKPRDFTAGKFKLRTTPSGQLPTDADLRRVIRQGMPYSSMPAWPQLTDDEVDGLVAYVKTFSADFSDPSLAPKPIDLPAAPAWSEASAAKGKEVYASLGCARCHGETGHGEGPSAPTLKDDRGRPIRPANLTQRWTFRGGPRREDIFRTFSTGLNGTPMPSYFDSLDVEGRWALTDYVYSLGKSDTPDYGTLVVARPIDGDVDLEHARELLAAAPRVRLPVVGQVMEPGRDFAPAATSIEVSAVFDTRRIALLVRWSDMRADTSGRSAPTMEVPPSEEELAPAAAPAEEGGGGFWGEDAEPASSGDDFRGEGGQDSGGGDDFWGESTGGAAPAATGPEFSDAVAIQLPASAPTGVARPYFLLGDAQRPVDLWFLDLSGEQVARFVGRGSGSLTPSDDGAVVGQGAWKDGVWEAVFVRDLRSRSGVSFAEGQYVPIALSVWDGTSRERGNRRGLTQWFSVYVAPRERPSVVGPMARSALFVLVAELLLVFWIRRRSRATPPA
jgi:mono/diheme cytochrome c family protein